VRGQQERAKAEKEDRKYTTKSFFQSQQAGLNLAVTGVPNADLLVKTLAVEPPESLQLGDLGVAVLNLAPQGSVKLFHLAVKLCREDFLLLGQPTIKLQLQR
jgi:hypothetical protein